MLPMIRTNPTSAPMTVSPFNRMGSLFDTFFGNDGGFAGQSWAGAPLSMWEDDDHLHVEVDMPGVAESAVDVTIHNGALFIRWEREAGEGRRCVYDGRSYGRFERVVSLPEAVGSDDVQAKLSDGVLALTLPKSPEAKPRKITLKTS